MFGCLFCLGGEIAVGGLDCQGGAGGHGGCRLDGMAVEAGDGKAALKDVVGLGQKDGAVDELQLVFFALDTLPR